MEKTLPPVIKIEENLSMQWDHGYELERQEVSVVHILVH
jgi:hypothetical protein